MRYSDYPEAAARLPRVGDATRIDMERLIALKPDLILGWLTGNSQADLERLARRGFPVFVTEAARLSDIARLIRVIGALAGTVTAADAAARAFEADLAALRQRYGARPPVRVFYEIWHRPLLTVNGRHIISDVISLCGGVNVFAGVPVLTPSISLEAVIAARPDVVLGGSSATSRGQFVSEWSGSRVASLRGLPVRYVPPDLIQRQTPRIAQGAQVVCEYVEEMRKR